MANLPTDYGSITKSLNKKSKKNLQNAASVDKGASEGPSMEGSRPALPAEPGTLKTSLLDTPGIDKMTEQESAHPVSSSQPSQMITNHTLENMPAKEENFTHGISQKTGEVDIVVTKSISLVHQLYIFVYSESI